MLKGTQNVTITGRGTHTTKANSPLPPIPVAARATVSTSRMLEHPQIRDSTQHPNSAWIPPDAQDSHSIFYWPHLHGLRRRQPTFSLVELDG
ncbi:hypothetical protein M378DRAFT_168302 [Amanita muscaria Koide BX008]|uniref:Uncharacterized protein n=1 Tax=Amanita muscaria (strain Koide BX008) TaxID=946122 RepID=A0A0C2WVB6_AMAMK|nr:hypothetical protein M378DRAFT_168302 [Amanita muscaria Koide BX008]